jgi:general secretion pathway protein A
MRPAMESPLPAGSSLLLVDAGGVVLAHHPNPERWIGEILDERLGTIAADQGAGLVAAADLDGTPALALSEPLFRDPTRAREASVVITLPRRTVVRDADRLFSLQLAGLGLLTLGGLVVSALVLDRVVARPAHGMLRVIRSLNAGDTRARMRRGDEDRSMVGHIARSLNALGRRLEEHEQTARHLEEQLRDARAMQVVSTLALAPAEPAAPAPPPPAEAETAMDAEPQPHGGFREPPFENAPNPKFLWLSPSHSDALVRLTYALRQRRGCALLTGEPGCGKTLITRAVVQRLEPKRYEIALLTNPHGGRIDLLRQVLYELGVDTAEPTRAELVHLLHDLVVRNFRRGRETLVIVDDAQEVDDPEWFEELSSLLNIQTNERTLVTLLLVGTTDLTDKVERVRHLDRRVSLRCTLGPLDAEQTGRYIRYRLGVAGGDESMFTPEAIAIVHAATRGVPRAINDLCDSALLLAHLDRRTSVDENLMRRVLSDTPTYVGAPDGPHTP